MVEIDKLRRISLADLKPLFSNVKRIREASERWIAERNNLTEEDIILFRREQLSKLRNKVEGTITFKDGLSIHIGADVDFVETMEIDRLFFRWEDQGRIFSKSIAVTSRPSNLGISAPVYYFICPVSGALCRKLYIDGAMMSGRRGFDHIYRKQTYSERTREFFIILEALDAAPHRDKHRKEYYRGKLTPYGLRQRRGLKALLRVGGREEARKRLDFMMIFCRRGRPRAGTIRRVRGL